MEKRIPALEVVLVVRVTAGQAFSVQNGQVRGRKPVRGPVELRGG